MSSPESTSPFQLMGRFLFLHTPWGVLRFWTHWRKICRSRCLTVTVRFRGSEVNNNQRSTRRLVLCVDRGPTQESMAGVATAHDSVEATFEDGEPGSEEDHPRHTQMEDVADTNSVGSVTTVAAEAIFFFLAPMLKTHSHAPKSAPGQKAKPPRHASRQSWNKSAKSGSGPSVPCKSTAGGEMREWAKDLPQDTANMRDHLRTPSQVRRAPQCGRSFTCSFVKVSAIPDDSAEEDDRESLWSVKGDLESADDVEEEIPFRHPGVRTCQLGFRTLDVVQLCDAFEQRGCLMQNVPRFLRGPFRRALRVALEEILKGARTNDTVTEERGWKLFVLLPRMLLHRPGRGGMVSKPKLVARFEMFVRGEWQALIEAGKSRRRRTERALTHRLARAEALVHLGELSAARQALEGAEVAPGSVETLDALRKRPAVPREVCPPELIRHRPEVLFALDEDHLNKNLRSTNRGAAGGPSGMTVEHLQPLLDHPKDLRLFFPSGRAFGARAGASGHSSRHSHGSFDSVAYSRWRSKSTIDGRSAAGNGSVSACSSNLRLFRQRRCLQLGPQLHQTLLGKPLCSPTLWHVSSPTLPNENALTKKDSHSFT